MRRRVGEREITYDDAGAGAPVVLLHPFPCNRRYWATVAAALAAPDRRLLTVDAPGFGESAAATTFAIADWADDVAALLDALDLATATVVGLSMGGYAALAMAARHRARLAALVLADTRAAADSAEVRRARADAIALLDSAGVAGYLDRSLPRLLAPEAPAAVLVQARALAETRADQLRAGIAALRDRPDRTAELSAILCPTLVLAGARDQVVPPEEMRGMAATIPGARFAILEGAGHLASLEAPGPFLAAVRGFLDQAAARQSGAA
ncbi:MAG TPA: alpha/beta fold hydrolase [Polyangia bacterium]|jgi:pimeloyl-ACP methyl ester carboxylesterase|nr:alpha/beta fold hydrolase [Polyangia bacterium]